MVLGARGTRRERAAVLLGAIAVSEAGGGHGAREVLELLPRGAARAGARDAAPHGDAPPRPRGGDRPQGTVLSAGAELADDALLLMPDDAAAATRSTLPPNGPPLPAAGVDGTTLPPPAVDDSVVPKPPNSEPHQPMEPATPPTIRGAVRLLLSLGSEEASDPAGVLSPSQRPLMAALHRSLRHSCPTYEEQCVVKAIPVVVGSAAGVASTKGEGGDARAAGGAGVDGRRRRTWRRNPPCAVARAIR